MSAAGLTERDPLLESFWERGLILFGDRVREEYGLQTPLFIDLRHKLYDDLSLLQALGRRICETILGLTEPSGPPQQVIGIPDTATPLALAAAIASRDFDRPLIYGQLRKRPAAYPGGRSGSSAYMGVTDPSREITLIDDVMASGRTKTRSIAQLAEDGLAVTRILVVVDREQGGDEILEGRGCPVHSLYRASELVRYFAATKRIDRETADEAIEFFESKRYE